METGPRARDYSPSSDVERSPLARFRSEAMRYQHTISAGKRGTWVYCSVQFNIYFCPFLCTVFKPFGKNPRICFTDLETGFKPVVLTTHRLAYLCCQCFASLDMKLAPV